MNLKLFSDKHFPFYTNILSFSYLLKTKIILIQEEDRIFFIIFSPKKII